MKKIKFLGASGTVTGSCYLLSRADDPGLLIDMGMFQGSKETTKLNYQALQFDPQNLEAVILTHAHLDHSGRLPILAKHGFNKPIFMTKPTKDLIEIALLDAAHIAEHDAEVTPMYAEEDVLDLLTNAEIVSYDQPFQIGHYNVVFKDAGHILGSASVVITDESADDGVKKLVFSGDLGNSPQDLLRPTELIDDAEVIVMESTYGGRTHTTEKPHDFLQREIREIEKTGGVLLIPAFSIERTQELLHILDHLKQENNIRRDTPVYLDSPMASRVTKVYKIYREYYGDELAEHARRDDPFSFEGLRVTKTREESGKIHHKEGPLVIIAGSGMMTGGRILHHAATYLPRQTTRLLFVGYQGIETIGREILEGKKSVFINDREIKVNATVSNLGSMSAHADEPKLLHWLKHIQNVKKVFLTHGDDIPRQDLAKSIDSQLNIKNVTLPKLNEEFTVDQSH